MESKSWGARFSVSEISGEIPFSSRKVVKGELQPQALQGGTQGGEEDFVA